MQPQEQYMEVDPYQQQSVMPMYSGGNEGAVTNIVGQIDPQTIIDNLDHALKGEQWNKEQAKWFMNEGGRFLVNDTCRGAIINYLTAKLNNNTTMAHIDEKRLSLFMEGIIEATRRMFVVNLEEFGFVPPGISYNEKIYYNKGVPDSSRMTLVSNMIYEVCFLVLSRAIKGHESYRIFKSLSMSDAMGGYGGMMGGGADAQKSGWLGKLFGRGK